MSLEEVRQRKRPRLAASSSTTVTTVAASSGGDTAVSSVRSDATSRDQAAMSSGGGGGAGGGAGAGAAAGSTATTGSSSSSSTTTTITTTTTTTTATTTGLRKSEWDAVPGCSRRPKVSIITAAHNIVPFASDFFASFFAQTYPGDIELSLFDDASTDDTPLVVRAWVAAMQKAIAISATTVQPPPLAMPGSVSQQAASGTASTSTTPPSSASVSDASATQFIRGSPVAAAAASATTTTAGGGGGGDTATATKDTDAEAAQALAAQFMATAAAGTPVPVQGDVRRFSAVLSGSRWEGGDPKAPARGPGYAKNKAVEQCTGECIAFLDAGTLVRLCGRVRHTEQLRP